MPPPYDTVVSIGGQSFVDGLWRLLGPALEGLTNPLPLALPGFTNATMRITQIVPVFPGSPPPAGALNLLATVELAAEALLNVNASAGDFTVTLGTQDLSLTNLTGTINLPEQRGNLTNIRLSGTLPAPSGTLSLGPGTGDLTLPSAAARLTGGLSVCIDGMPGAPEDVHARRGLRAGHAGRDHHRRLHAAHHLRPRRRGVAGEPARARDADGGGQRRPQRRADRRPDRGRLHPLQPGRRSHTCRSHTSRISPGSSRRPAGSRR